METGCHSNFRAVNHLSRFSQSQRRKQTFRAKAARRLTATFSSQAKAPQQKGGAGGWEGEGVGKRAGMGGVGGGGQVWGSGGGGAQVWGEWGGGGERP